MSNFAKQAFISTIYIMDEEQFRILKRLPPLREAYFYQKAETLYHLTYAFCSRFISQRDRTFDQMVQAARSGKQNIVEGCEDGVTSSEMQIKLLNVARSSFQELREDYRDYLISRSLQIWNSDHPRFKKMQQFCRTHNRVEDYAPYFNTWNHEDMANTALTLCYMVDSMLNNYLKFLEKEFVTQGGIKERMYAARTGYRQAQDLEFKRLKEQNSSLSAEIAALRAERTEMLAELTELKQKLSLLLKDQK